MYHIIYTSVSSITKMAAQMHIGSNMIQVIVALINMWPCYLILSLCHPIKYLIGDMKISSKVKIMLYSSRNFWCVKSPTLHTVDTEEMFRFELSISHIFLVNSFSLQYNLKQCNWWCYGGRENDNNNSIGYFYDALQQEDKDLTL